MSRALKLAGAVVVTTVFALVGIWALNRFGIGRTIVGTALQG